MGRVAHINSEMIITLIILSPKNKKKEPTEWVWE